MLFCALLVFKFNFFFRKSLAVVLYDKAEVVNAIYKTDFYIARVCMAADVGKRFLQDSDKFNLNIFA